MEQRLPGLTLITQNVDGMHQRAGNKNVLELHGSLIRTRCTRDGKIVTEWDADGPIPHCRACGAMLRPDVVWFGEMLPAGALEEALAAARNCDWSFSIGTSGLVEPAASLAYEARRSGARIVEINPQPTPLSLYATYLLQAPAGEVLPELVQAVWGN